MINRRKVITAINMSKFNRHLVEEYREVEVLMQDLEYQEELFTALAQRQDVEVLLLSDKLSGPLSKYELVEHVMKIGDSIRIISFLEEPEDSEYKRFLRRNGINSYFDGSSAITDIVQAILFGLEEESILEEVAAAEEPLAPEETSVSSPVVTANKVYIEKEIVTIASPGGGGVGKTTVAINLGVAAAKKYKECKIVIVDFNTEKPDVGRILNIEANSGLEKLWKAVKTEEFTSKNILDSLELYNFSSPNLFIMPGLKTQLELNQFTMYHYKEILGVLKKEFDLVIVDTGAFNTDETYAAIEKASKVVFVIRDTETTVDSLKGKIDFYTNDLAIEIGKKMEIMMNMTVGYEKLNEVAIKDIFGREPIGNLKLNPEIIFLNEAYKPFAVQNNSKTRHERKQIERALERIYTYVEKKDGKSLTMKLKERIGL